MLCCSTHSHHTDQVCTQMVVDSKTCQYLYGCLKDSAGSRSPTSSAHFGQRLPHPTLQVPPGPRVLACCQPRWVMPRPSPPYYRCCCWRGCAHLQARPGQGRARWPVPLAGWAWGTGSWPARGSCHGPAWAAPAC